jgi:hypothetical protein
MTGIHVWFGRGDHACGIVEKPDDVVIQRALITLQRQRIVTALVYDLLRDRALAV